MAVVRDIELRPHTAFNREGEEVTFAQDQIFLNGMRVGYVGHGEGEGASLIRPCDAGTIEAISAAIAEKRGSAPAHVHTAPVIQEKDDE
jgi:hypothetical protein